MGAAKEEKSASLRIAVILAVSIVAVHLAVLAFIKDQEMMLYISDALLTTTAGLAVLCSLHAARNLEGGSRWAWTVLAIAMIFDTFGEASWAIIENVLHQNPFPSVADVGYLMFYPLFAMGVLLLPEVPLLPRERLKISPGCGDSRGFSRTGLLGLPDCSYCRITKGHDL